MYGCGHVGGKTIIGKFPIQSWLPNGVPVYSVASLKPAVVRPDSDGGEQAVYVDNFDHVYLCRGYGYEGNDKDGIDVYDQNSNWLWGIAETKQQQPDDILANSIIGEFTEPHGEDIIGSWLWHGNFKPYLFTSDGLYVSSLLDDTQLGPTATWDESYKRYFQGPDGTAYIVNGGKDTFHIDKIVGLDQLHRFTGTITVTEAALRSSQARAQILASTPAPLPQPVIHVTYVKSAPKIDGDLSDWDMRGGVALIGSRNRSAHVALTRDADTLYLAYDVHGAKFVNKGTDWRTMFISGDCVNLMLHVGEFKPHFGPAEGDERLLFSIYQGQPVAVLYRPVVPGTANPVHLMATTIDQIVRLPSAKIAYHRTAGGYTLEASVPLKDIGLGGGAVETLKGDVGVIYADETGSDRSLRLYYYNKHTAMTADLTTEATLQPGEWGDIELPLGVNLLKNGDFEDPLATSPDDGWAIQSSRAGATAEISSDFAYTGSHSLELEATVPNSYADADINRPASEKDEFFRSVNGGKGGARVEVRQRVVVSPGKRYDLRLHYHVVDYPNANDHPGAQRGYCAFQTYIEWEGPVRGILVNNLLGPVGGWNLLHDDRWNNYDVKGPYLAPTGVDAMLVHLTLEDNATLVTPKVYIDDAELVEAA